MILQKFSQVCYYFMFILLCSYIILSLVFDKKVDIPVQILAIFSLLLLPIIDGIYNSIFEQDMSSSMYPVKKKIITFLDSRIFFGGALILFCYVVFFLILWDSPAAEKFSIYAYYLLLIWVIFQIGTSVIASRNTKK